MTLTTETLVIATFVILAFLVSAIRSSVKHEGFFRSLYWTLKGTTLIFYHILMFVGSFFDGVLRGLLGGAKRKRQKRISASTQQIATGSAGRRRTKEAMQAVAWHLEHMCHVKPFIDKAIFKDLRQRPDVWAHKGNRWYLCEVKRAGWPDLSNATMELDTMRTQIWRHNGKCDVSCYAGVTTELYDSLTDEKRTQLHDSARSLHCGILTISQTGKCKVV